MNFPIKLIISSLFLLFLIYLDCKNEGPFDPSLYHPTFKGITYTTDEFTIISEDIEDWHLSSESPYQDLFVPYEIVEKYTPSSPTQIPRFYSMEPPYPNPSNDSINFRYHLAQEASVLIFIIDSNRRVIVQLLNKVCSAGSYMFTWNLENSHGHKVPGNIYRCIYRLGHWMGYGDIWVK